MRLAIALVLVLVSSSGALAAEKEQTMRDMLAMMKTGHIYKAYFVGAGNGMRTANYILQVRGDRKLFCDPDIDFADDQYIKILENFLDKHPEKAKASLAGYQAVLAMAMVEAFPCP